MFWSKNFDFPFVKMKNFKIILTMLIVIILNNKLISQNSFQIINNNEQKYFESYLYSKNNLHTLLKPVIITDSLYKLFIDTTYKRNNNNLHNIFFLNNLISLNKKNIKLKINPIITNLVNNNYYTENGLVTNLQLGKNLFLYAQYTYINCKTNDKTTNFTDSTGFLPHFGKAFINPNNNSLNNFNGAIIWQAADFINFQFGKENNFWGDGYRSLLLSDNSATYPFFKGTVDIWKIKYIILYSMFKEPDSVGLLSDLSKKYSSSHILSYNIGKRFNFNLFETVIWRDKDSLGYRGFDVNYLNPIIFYRPVEYSIGSPDNVIMGFGTKIRFFKNTHLYGQFLLDEFKLSEIKANKGWWGNKFAIQVGIKSYKFLNINRFFALYELNLARPFTYSHSNYFDNWGNNFQPLAHPLGANFYENILQLKYEKKRLIFNMLYKTSKQGIDTGSVNFGYNIYRSYNDNRNENGNYFLQGKLNNIKLFEFNICFVINPSWQLYLKVGYRNIKDNFASRKSTDLFIFGLYTSIGNREGLY